jgi:hypothetical protein
MRAAHAVAPSLANPPQRRLPTTDVRPLARSKCRRRRRGAPPCRRHARGGGRFSVLLPLRARNRLWFGLTKRFRVGRYVANRRSINSKTLPQCVYMSIGQNPFTRNSPCKRFFLSYITDVNGVFMQKRGCKKTYRTGDGVRCDFLGAYKYFVRSRQQQL